MVDMVEPLAGGRVGIVPQLESGPVKAGSGPSASAPGRASAAVRDRAAGQGGGTGRRDRAAGQGGGTGGSRGFFAGPSSAGSRAPGAGGLVAGKSRKAL